MSAVAEITDEEVRSLTQSILTRYGIDFTCYEPKSLKRRIIRTMSVFDFVSIFELWSRLLKDTQFIYSFMNEISVGMTSMFRDPVLWRQLKQMLPQEYKNQDNISIWHSGCSTGEEVYTMGIVMKEVGLLAQAKALATDINQNALETAQLGEYHKIKLVENERNYGEYSTFGNFTRYYTTDGKTGLMNKELVQNVTFRYHNLITDAFVGQYDIIFCRNVMIYFDQIAKSKLLEKFHMSLKPGGYFIIGFYDTMLSIVDQKRFRLVNESAKIFKKI